MLFPTISVSEKGIPVVPNASVKEHRDMLAQEIHEADNNKRLPKRRVQRVIQ